MTQNKCIWSVCSKKGRGEEGRERENDKATINCYKLGNLSEELTVILILFFAVLSLQLCQNKLKPTKFKMSPNE